MHAQSCPTLCDITDCSPPGSSVHGISQARILERVAISFSWGSSRPRNGTRVSCTSCTGRRVLYHCAAWEPGYLIWLLGNPMKVVIVAFIIVIITFIIIIPVLKGYGNLSHHSRGSRRVKRSEAFSSHRQAVCSPTRAVYPGKRSPLEKMPPCLLCSRLQFDPIFLTLLTPTCAKTDSPMLSVN